MVICKLKENFYFFSSLPLPEVRVCNAVKTIYLGHYSVFLLTSELCGIAEKTFLHLFFICEHINY